MIELFLELAIFSGWLFLDLLNFVRQLLENRIRLHLLLDEVPQFEERSLQDEQALLKLRSENLLQRQVLRLVHPRTGHLSYASEAGMRKASNFRAAEECELLYQP